MVSPPREKPAGMGLRTAKHWTGFRRRGFCAAWGVPFGPGSVPGLHFRITTRANTMPSAAAVTAVPAIMDSNGRRGGGMSQSSHLASDTNTSKPPAAGSSAGLNFSVTSPF
jgi:hypothetical protein